MKKIPMFLIASGMLLLFSFSSCEENGPKTETINFKAEFYTQLVSFEEDAGCSAPKNFLNTQQGGGTATLVGNFTTQLTFCVNPANFEYDNVQGSFVAENGNEIFVVGSGQVVPTEKEGYDLEFMDPFEINGGTGQFEGATGSGTTESYVNMTTGITDHVWTGKITIKK